MRRVSELEAGQGDLFASYAARETAWNAGAKNTAIRSRLALRILDLHERHKDSGLTDDECTRLLGDDLLAGSVAKRRLDLVRLGLLKDRGDCRRTRRNSDATVWVLR